MKLIHSPTSPYARKARILIREKKLDVEEIATVPFDDEAVLHTANPLGKVPALLVGETAVYDSPVICEYLDALDNPWLPNDKAAWRQKTLHALGDGIIDAVLAFRMERIRPQEQWWDFWAMRQENATVRALQHLETITDELGAPWEFGNLSIACALGYVDFRASDMQWRDHMSKLAKWFETFEKLDSWKQTAPPK
ncbi:MAG: glutathione S-transferase N-terminal domain-containing protein [Robiginitomaculum sp.]|nr:glutathione S-transferase N-terminal domain-containing protein [Robiginitomaculum sp.]